MTEAESIIWIFILAGLNITILRFVAAYLDHAGKDSK